MSTQAITTDMIGKLRAPLPPEAIKPHPTKSYLSTIKVIYAVERLNEVFGLNGWKVRNEVIESTGSMVVVKATLTVPEFGIEVENFGGNDNPDRGDAYKGACTDALSKICSYLYIGMDVYKGHDANGAPRTEQPRPVQQSRPQQPSPAPQAASNKPFSGKKVISEAQAKRFFALSKNGGWNQAEIQAKLKEFGFNSSKEITWDKYEQLCTWVQTEPPVKYPEHSDPNEITDQDIPF